jgi:hypothetical protein
VNCFSSMLLLIVTLPERIAPVAWVVPMVPPMASM